MSYVDDLHRDRSLILNSIQTVLEDSETADFVDDLSELLTHSRCSSGQEEPDEDAEALRRSEKALEGRLAS